jgi:hypothetical protein
VRRPPLNRLAALHRESLIALLRIRSQSPSWNEIYALLQTALRPLDPEFWSLATSDRQAARAHFETVVRTRCYRQDPVMDRATAKAVFEIGDALMNDEDDAQAHAQGCIDRALLVLEPGMISVLGNQPACRLALRRLGGA